MMKKLLTVLFLLTAVAGKTQADTSLRARLDKFLVFSEKMDIDAALDLTYPRLFTIVSRADMKKEMAGMLEMEDVKIRMDSLRIDTIFPVFQHEKGSYAKVIYTMNIHMQITGEEATDDPEEVSQMVQIFESQYGEGNVEYNKDRKEYKLRNRSEMIAIRDDISPEWTFLNFETDSPLTGILFGDKLLAKLALYK